MYIGKIASLFEVTIWNYLDPSRKVTRVMARESCTIEADWGINQKARCDHSRVQYSLRCEITHERSGLGMGHVLHFRKRHVHAKGACGDGSASKEQVLCCC